MSIAKLISWMTARHPAKRSEMRSYEAIFKGSPTALGANEALPSRLQPVGYDADAYFKEVFAGPVF